MTTAVLLAAAGAPWELRLLADIGRSEHVTLARRCLDLDEVLAAARERVGDEPPVAVVNAALPGLDEAFVAEVRGHGVTVLAVGGPGSSAVLEVLDPEGLVAALEAPPSPASGAATETPPDGSRIEAAGPPPRHRVIAVWGPEGAPGRTTVAISVAALAAEAGEPGAVLIDADACAPAVAVSLSVTEQVSGLLAAARAVTARDGDEARDGVLSALRGVAPGLAVLTGLPGPEHWSEIPAGALTAVVEAARSHGHVVLDLAAPLDPGGPDLGPARHQLTREALAAADAVVVVGAADPVSLARLAARLDDLHRLLLRSTGELPRLVVVVNRTRRTLGWGEHDLAALIRQLAPTAEAMSLPEDRRLWDRLLRDGATVASRPRSDPTRRFFEILTRSLVNGG